MHNKSLFFFLFFSVLFFNFGHTQVKFPEDNLMLGYEISQVHARVAFPLNGKNRIWVKGNPEFNEAIIFSKDNSIRLKSIKLLPPFFTDVVEVNESEVAVSFQKKETGELLAYGRLYPGTYNDLESDNFSILLYGCLEPFQIVEEDGKGVSKIFEGEKNSSFRVRSLFQNIAMGNSISYSDSIKEGDTYIFNGNKELPLLDSKPKLIITTGDQVYIDAGYEYQPKNGEVHPLSAWETKRRPYPYNSSITAYQAYLNSLYSATYSFSQLETAHRYLPTLATIDDHELRDGWGSQGDEYEKGTMNAKLAPFYNFGKQAFIEHQLLLGNRSVEDARALLEKNTSMHSSFSVNGKNGYVFDLRSGRNVAEGTVMDSQQWEDFENWLNNLERDQEIILVTSIPLTLKPLKFFENVIKLVTPELRDDVRDGWSYRKNKADRDRLLQLLMNHRVINDIKPIFVSGDVHKSALIEIWADTHVRSNGKLEIMDSFILGYEIVASGISHEFIKTGITKSIFKISESQNIGGGIITFDYDDGEASIFPMVRASNVTQNFGAIEFQKDNKTRLHTFIYNQEKDALEQQYLILDFDKVLPNDDYFIENELENSDGKEYAPPIPQGKRIIKN